MKTNILTLLTVGTLLAASLPAQQQDRSNQVGLETPSLDGGNTVTFRLRSTAVGQPARLLIGSAAVQPLGLPHGLLLVDTTPGLMFTGAVGSDGLYEVTLPLPSPLGIPNGFPVAMQGAVLLTGGNIVLSDRSVVIAEASADAD